MKCYIGNLGDTRAVLCENEKALRVSTDHKASNESEIKRIKFRKLSFFLFFFKLKQNKKEKWAV